METNTMDNASVAPRPGAQNVTIYVCINAFMIVLQLLGGWAGYTFFGNMFLGCTVILSFVCLSIVTMEKNTDYAKRRELGWWNFMPILVGFISLGFSWYFTWVCWWAMCIAMVTKKIVGDEELQEEQRKSKTVPVPSPSYPDEEDML